MFFPAELKMNDTFLVTHQISALRFSIGGLLSPISIRDQMVRAKMFVDRAIDEHLISARRGLFVVGAGAAGVTAAMYAASMGFPVTLIDRRERPFHLQRECHTRWIDPTQYDWPASHWNEGIFPWDSNMWDAEAAPLRWAADLAYNVAAGWHQELDLAVQDYKGILEYLPLMKYIGTDDPAPGHELKVLFRNIVDGENELSIAEEREVCPGFDSEALTGEKPLLTRQCGALLDARGFPRDLRAQHRPTAVAGVDMRIRRWCASRFSSDLHGHVIRGGNHGNIGALD